MEYIICPKCGQSETVEEMFNDGLYYEYKCECGAEWSQKWFEDNLE